MFYYFIYHFKNAALQIISCMLSKFIFSATEIICFVCFYFSFYCYMFFFRNWLDLIVVASYFFSYCCLINYIFHFFFYVCFYFFLLAGFYSGYYKPFYLFCIYNYIPMFVQYCSCFFLWLHILNTLPKTH